MVDNKSYRYGDGLFETMKVTGEKISLETYHFERFFLGLKQMAFKIPELVTPESLKQEIFSLYKKNECGKLARVRLSAFRGNGGLYENDNFFQYIIECWPVEESVNQLNQDGLVIDIYPDARKSCDKFSNLKSACYLPYVMAAHYAKENKFNDCLVLNTFDRIADATIANIFLIKGGKIMTPALSEGCVSGVMRRWLIERYHVEEIALQIEDVLSADELFLTNAMQGVRWIKQFREKTFENSRVSKIHHDLANSTWR